MWYLTHQRERAMWWYNRVFMPLSVRLQKKLALAPGLLDTEHIDEVLLVCRKRGAITYSWSEECEHSEDDDNESDDVDDPIHGLPFVTS